MKGKGNKKQANANIKRAVTSDLRGQVPSEVQVIFDNARRNFRDKNTK